ncbi:MAG TPA: hypothetical protein DHW02_15720 [Ktedonobacter sp.]|nr:hypothetical protein [Ktedonobacter sp.]
MWSNNWIRKVCIIVTCVLIVGIAICGSVLRSQSVDAATASSSHTNVASSNSVAATNAATFQVTSIDMTVTPATTSTWTCGSYIQVVYNAVFHVVSGPHGGTIVFSYTVNNGRSQTMEKLTILPGQYQSNFTFTWQGSLPSDHTYPEPGGVLVTSPNSIVSSLVAPAGKCR